MILQTSQRRINKLGIQGDELAEKFHGGVDKTLHHYAFDHYDFWRKNVPALLTSTGQTVLSVPGAFGENISTWV